MDIRFYTGDGKLKHVCGDFLRVTWQTCLKDEGNSEIQLLKGHELLNILEKEPVLIVKYGENQGIVTGFEVKGEYLFIWVKSLLTLLTRRLFMGNFGEEEFLLSGNPLELIRDKILPLAPYITLKGEVLPCTEKTITLKCGETLLEVSKKLLSGTNVGMKIEFEPKSASYSFSFVYPKEYFIRLSFGNKNLADVSLSKDNTLVKNSGFFILPFYPPEDFDPYADTSLIGDNDPENFLKQYKITQTATLQGHTIYEGQYIYCDTEDGKLKLSDTEKTLSTRYISLEENPVLVFQQDLRKHTKEECLSLLEIRKYISEKWNVQPVLESPLALGTEIFVEKEIGVEKGIKKLQVVSVKTDTESPLPDIELE